jgi:VIT1/CCC1 family predicted Fe2+/Mn2+ transporter
MSQTFVVDSRLPVSENQSEDDPNHPKNVAKNAAMVSAQANADTKYDIYPPPRVAGFVDYGTHNPWKTTKQIEKVTTIAAFIAIVVAFFIALKSQIFFIKLGAAVVLIMCLNYIVGKIEKRTVYNFESREAI